VRNGAPLALVALLAAVSATVPSAAASSLPNEGAPVDAAVDVSEVLKAAPGCGTTGRI
jgi:hypothetical protein